MFIASSKDGEQGLDFFIIGPNKRIVYSSRKRTEGIFSFNATLPGQYSFIFNNMKWRTEKKVTFGLQFRYNLTDSEEQSGEEIVYEDLFSAPTSNDPEYQITEELTRMEDEYLKIIHALSSLQIEQRVSARQQDMHNDNVDSNNKFSYYFGYGEALSIVLFAGFQVYYVMRMLEKRVLL